jgi:hypothetical protein
MDVRPDEMPPYLVATMSRATGLGLSSCRIEVRPPLAHQSNRLYDVWAGERHLIAKEFLDLDQIHEAPAREFRALRLLSPHDIAPQPVYFDAAVAPVVVYEYVDGVMWDRRTPTSHELAHLAELWIRVNSLTLDGSITSTGYERWFVENQPSFGAAFDLYAQWAKARFAPGQRAAKTCLELLQQRQVLFHALATSSPALCFSQSDARFSNIIRRPDGRLAIVDWEDSGLHDPIGDVADLMMHANQEDLLSPSEWQAFVHPYLAARTMIDPDAAERLRSYIGIICLYWLVILLGRGVRLAERGALVGWTVNGMSVNQRLRRFLARAIAWPDLNPDLALETVGDMVFFPD